MERKMMDIEQLKLILEAVSAASEGAFWIAIIYLGTDIFETVLWFCFGIAFLYAFHKLIMTMSGHAGIAELAKKITNDRTWRWDYDPDVQKLHSWIRDKMDK